MNSDRPIHTNRTLNWICATWVRFSLRNFVVFVAAVVRLRYNSVSIKTKLVWVEMICDHAIESFFSIIFLVQWYIAININCWELVLFNNIEMVFFALNCINISMYCSRSSPVQTMCESKSIFLWAMNKFCDFQPASQPVLYSGNQHVLYANSHLFVVLIHIYP